jgi:hypothetical protein
VVDVLQMIDKRCRSSLDSAMVDHNNSVCLHK